MKRPKRPEIARGPGPWWLRIALVFVAFIYYFALVKHIRVESLRPFTFFTDATCLFPQADVIAQEFRLEGYSCERRAWEPLDPRPYFPIEADDKESRFQRLAYFYQHESIAMRALDDYIEARHGNADDGIAGPIGGIRMYRWGRPIPDPTTCIDRYVYRPLAPVPADQRKDKDYFHTPQSKIKARCGF